MYLKLKSWLRNKNEANELLWLRKLSLSILNLKNTKRTIPELFYYLMNPLRFKIFSIKNNCYLLDLSEDITHRVFTVFVKEKDDRKVVIKIPRRDNFYSTRFVNKLQSTESLNDFTQVLKGLSDKKYIGSYISEVEKVFEDGGYVSTYFEGENLVTILNNTSILNEEERLNLKSDLSELLVNLKKELDSGNAITGDWAIHNLMYNRKSRQLMNVDLEGFYMYNDNKKEAQFDFIEQQFKSIFD